MKLLGGLNVLVIMICDNWGLGQIWSPRPKLHGTINYKIMRYHFYLHYFHLPVIIDELSLAQIKFSIYLIYFS